MTGKVLAQLFYNRPCTYVFEMINFEIRGVVVRCDQVRLLLKSEYVNSHFLPWTFRDVA